MTVDVEQFRTLLDEERRRVLDAIEYLHKENPGSIEDETEEMPIDNHLAETATATLDREIDYTLEENSEHVLAAIDCPQLLHVPNVPSSIRLSAASICESTCSEFSSSV